MNRNDQLNSLKTTPLWDILIIGGGASGLGAAVDASSRGYTTVLFEAFDFAKGTSSRSTKLAHGGVRYLQKGNIRLVVEALRERGILARNARHLFVNKSFIIPNYKWWEGLYYIFGLKLYDLLSGRLSLGSSKLLSKKTTKSHLPTINDERLWGGVSYQDGQFDDARLAINLAQTAQEQGGAIMNYMKVTDVIKDEAGQLKGVVVTDQETSIEHHVFSKAVINATGVFANKILKLNGRNKKALKVVPSQGVHLVLDASFLPGDSALMVPKTSDGRVLFIVPWREKLVVGTTDTPIKKPSYEPKPLEEEIEFILKTASDYLKKTPTRKDVLSVFAGLRPLVAPEGDKKNTKEISRGHQIIISESGLISILGGKWTTYRLMAEQIINTSIKHAGLEPKQCVTKKLAIHGDMDPADQHNGIYKPYGSDGEALKRLIESKPEYQRKLHKGHPFLIGQVVWAIRYEMARTVDDILSRRIRLLFFDSEAAIECSPVVSQILADELGKDDSWRDGQHASFISMAGNYQIKSIEHG